MTQSLNVNQGGTWKKVYSVAIKDSGVWKNPTGVWVNRNGVWVQAYPDPSGIQTFTTPLPPNGASPYSFTVPAGKTSITVSIVGGGGGSGGTFGSGSIYAQGGGGSGGYILNQTLSVTPGQILKCVVGDGGYGGNWHFNAYNEDFNGYNFLGIEGLPNYTGYQVNPGTYNGGSGGTTYIADSLDNVLLQATGGGGGASSGGSGGAGGSPNGVAGQGNNPVNTGSCNILPWGGDNGTKYGKGGDCPQCHPGLYGQSGFISISW